MFLILHTFIRPILVFILLILGASKPIFKANVPTGPVELGHGTLVFLSLPLETPNSQQWKRYRLPVRHCLAKFIYYRTDCGSIVLIKILRNVHDSFVLLCVVRHSLQLSTQSGCGTLWRQRFVYFLLR